MDNYSLKHKKDEITQNLTEKAKQLEQSTAELMDAMNAFKKKSEQNTEELLHEINEIKYESRDAFDIKEEEIKELNRKNRLPILFNKSLDILCMSTIVIASFALVFPVINAIKNSAFYNKYNQDLFKSKTLEEREKILLENIGLKKMSIFSYEKYFFGKSANSIIKERRLINDFFSIDGKRLSYPFGYLRQFSPSNDMGEIDISSRDMKTLKSIIEETKIDKKTSFYLSINQSNEYSNTNHALGIKTEKISDQEIKITILNSNWFDLKSTFKYLFSKAMEDKNIKITVENEKNIAYQKFTHYCVHYTFYNLNKDFFNEIGINYETDSKKHFDVKLNLALYFLSAVQYDIIKTGKTYSLDDIKQNPSNYQQFIEICKNFLNDTIQELEKSTTEKKFLDVIDDYKDKCIEFLKSNVVRRNLTYDTLNKVEQCSSIAQN